MPNQSENPIAGLTNPGIEIERRQQDDEPLVETGLEEETTETMQTTEQHDEDVYCMNTGSRIVMWVLQGSAVLFVLATIVHLVFTDMMWLILLAACLHMSETFLFRPVVWATRQSRRIWASWRDHTRRTRIWFDEPVRLMLKSNVASTVMLIFSIVGAIGAFTWAETLRGYLFCAGLSVTWFVFRYGGWWIYVALANWVGFTWLLEDAANAVLGFGLTRWSRSKPKPACDS